MNKKDVLRNLLLTLPLAALAACSQPELNIGSPETAATLEADYEKMSLYAESLDGFVLEDGQKVDSLLMKVLRDCNVPIASADSIEAKARLFKHAKTLMDSIVAIDSHCDFPERRYYHPEYGCDFGASQCNARFSIEKMRQGHLAAVCMAVWMDPPSCGQLDPAGIASAPDSLWKFIGEMDEHFKSHNDRCGIARSREEADSLHRQGKKTVMYALENAYWIGSDLGNIKKLADLGFVYITLSHQGDNHICNSCNASADPSKGLTKFGREVVREMNRRGIIIDLSHTSYGTQRDVIELSCAPVIYTHSCCRALYDNPRNVDDETMKLLAAKGGVIQITMFPGFIAPKEKRNEVGLKEFVDHICHVVETVGIDHVGVGCDFDGGGRGVGLDGANDAVALTMRLIEKGFSDEDIAKIWGGNFFRVLDAVRAAAKPRIVGHRGVRFNTPDCPDVECYENTIPAFKFCQSLGIYAAEFDVQLTKDEKIIVYHGPKIPGEERTIHELTFAQARETVLPAGHRMPTLEEWFAQAKLHPETKIICEIKKQSSPEREIEACRQVMETVRRLDMQSQIEYTTFSEVISKEIHRLDPSAKLLFLDAGENAQTPEQCLERGDDAISYDIKALLSHPDYVDRAHALGMEVTMWIVNDTTCVDWAIAHGVDYVSSDHPEKIKEYLQGK